MCLAADRGDPPTKKKKILKNDKLNKKLKPQKSLKSPGKKMKPGFKPKTETNPPKMELTKETAQSRKQRKLLRYDITVMIKI